MPFGRGGLTAMEENEITTEKIMVRPGDRHFDIVLDVVQVHTSANIFEEDETTRRLDEK